MADQDPGDSVETLRLARLFFVLPEPISLPDGYQVVRAAGDEGSWEVRTDDPPVSLIIHQVNAAHGRSTAALEALTKATSAAPGLPPQSPEPLSLELNIPWTVLEAVTPWESPDPIPANDEEHPAYWTPRMDVITRCLYAARQMVRAYRQATDAVCGLPTYVRAISPMLVYFADGLRETVDIDGVSVMVLRPLQSEWDGPSLMMLDHKNLPDSSVQGKDFDENTEARFWWWYSEEMRGNPLNLWRERWFEARRANEVFGEEGQAVILANTSCEVLLDVILALLMWEEGLVVENVAGAFEDGKVLRRITQELAPRLKGDWSTDRGAVGHWYRSAYRLRHRVIHGGYVPTSREGSEALDAAAGLHKFVMDRIAERRTTYPRASLMTVAEGGLRKRGVWSGRIKRFAETDALSEPDWRDSYVDWYRDLVTVLTP